MNRRQQAESVRIGGEDVDIISLVYGYYRLLSATMKPSGFR